MTFTNLAFIFGMIFGVVIMAALISGKEDI